MFQIFGFKRYLGGTGLFSYLLWYLALAAAVISVKKSLMMSVKRSWVKRITSPSIADGSRVLLRTP